MAYTIAYRNLLRVARCIAISSERVCVCVVVSVCVAEGLKRSVYENSCYRNAHKHTQTQTQTDARLWVLRTCTNNVALGTSVTNVHILLCAISSGPHIPYSLCQDRPGVLILILRKFRHNNFRPIEVQSHQPTIFYHFNKFQ